MKTTPATKKTNKEVKAFKSFLTDMPDDFSAISAYESTDNTKVIEIAKSVEDSVYVSFDVDDLSVGKYNTQITEIIKCLENNTKVGIKLLDVYESIEVWIGSDYLKIFDGPSSYVIIANDEQNRNLLIKALQFVIQ